MVFQAVAHGFSKLWATKMDHSSFSIFLRHKKKAIAKQPAITMPAI